MSPFIPSIQALIDILTKDGSELSTVERKEIVALVMLAGHVRSLPEGCVVGKRDGAFVARFHSSDGFLWDTGPAPSADEAIGALQRYLAEQGIKDAQTRPNIPGITRYEKRQVGCNFEYLVAFKGPHGPIRKIACEAATDREAFDILEDSYRRIMK